MVEKKGFYSLDFFLRQWAIILLAPFLPVRPQSDLTLGCGRILLPSSEDEVRGLKFDEH